MRMKMTGDQQDKVKISFLNKYASFILPTILLCSDYISIIAAEGVAFYLRKKVLPLLHADFAIPNLYFYIITPIIFMSFLHFANTYIRSTPFWKMSEQIFWATCYSTVTVIILMYFGGVAGGVSRIYVALTCSFVFLFILISRYAIKNFFSRIGLVQIPIIFIGAGKTAELVLQFFTNDSGFGYKVIGIIDDDPVSQLLVNRFKLLGKFCDAEQIIKESGVQNVIITAPGLPSEKLIKLINRVQPHVKNLAFVPDLIGAPMGSLSVESLFDEKIMMLKVQNNLARRYNRIYKSMFDLAASLLGLIFILPLGMALCLLIYLDSPGPVLFSHRRIGKGGREFPCYKFRTMVPNASMALEQYLAQNPAAREEWNRDFKLKDDPRVTKIGRFLRKTSLDELPQLLNVLKGEMSLVGPRPIVRAEIEKYGDYINDYYLVPPGITGMWQVNGRSDTTYDERVQMDSWYVRNWCVWIDIVYLLKTVKVVIRRKGAY